MVRDGKGYQMFPGLWKEKVLQRRGYGDAHGAMAKDFRAEEQLAGNWRCTKWTPEIF